MSKKVTIDVYLNPLKTYGLLKGMHLIRHYNSSIGTILVKELHYSRCLNILIFFFLCNNKRLLIIYTLIFYVIHNNYCRQFSNYQIRKPY